MNNHFIVQAARSWTGTAFRHQGRRKAVGADKGGVDCLGLLIGVARECGMAVEDRHDYGHYPDEAGLYAGLRRYLGVAEEMRPGDVLLMRIDGHARHVGIVGDYCQAGFKVQDLRDEKRGVPPLLGEGRVGFATCSVRACGYPHLTSPIGGGMDAMLGNVRGDTVLSLIHAYAPARAVVEHRLDEMWREKVVAVFRWR